MGELKNKIIELHDKLRVSGDAKEFELITEILKLETIKPLSLEERLTNLEDSVKRIQDQIVRRWS